MVVSLEHEVDLVIHEDGLQVELEIEIAPVRAGVGVHGLVEVDEFPALRRGGEILLDPVVHVGVEFLVSVERDEVRVPVVE